MTFDKFISRNQVNNGRQKTAEKSDKKNMHYHTDITWADNFDLRHYQFRVLEKGNAGALF